MKKHESTADSKLQSDFRSETRNWLDMVEEEIKRAPCTPEEFARRQRDEAERAAIRLGQTEPDL